MNTCSRCGKERIVAKSWEEEIITRNGRTTIRHTQTVCPDSKCQNKVEAENDARKLLFK